MERRARPRALPRAAQLFLSTATPLPTAFAADFLWALTIGNLLTAAFNLIPVPPLDGKKAWRLIVLGPLWLVRKMPEGVPFIGRFERWRRRKHLRVVEKDPPLN